MTNPKTYAHPERHGLYCNHPERDANYAPLEFGLANGTTADRIRWKCNQISEMLIEKNQAYGDSALHPIGVFAHGKASDMIRVRMDDKLNRIRNNPEFCGEDPVMDLMGYLVLFSLALEDERQAAATPETYKSRPGDPSKMDYQKG